MTENIDLVVQRQAKRCEHCKARIVWATDVEGTRYPVDVDSVHDGTVALSVQGDAIRAVRVTRGQAAGMMAAGLSLFKRHALTCPKAAEWARNVTYRYAAPQRGMRRRRAPR